MSIITSREQLKLELVISAQRIAEPLQQFEDRETSDAEISLPNGRNLFVSELLMVALMLSSSDNQITEDETNLINEISQAIQGKNALAVSSTDFLSTYRDFVARQPVIRLSLDQIPLSVHRLQIFDEEHGTSYAEEAKSLFLRFATVVASADGETREREKVALANFEAILYPEIE